MSGRFRLRQCARNVQIRNFAETGCVRDLARKCVLRIPCTRRSEALSARKSFQFQKGFAASRANRAGAGAYSRGNYGKALPATVNAHVDPQSVGGFNFFFLPGQLHSGSDPHGLIKNSMRFSFFTRNMFKDKRAREMQKRQRMEGKMEKQIRYYLAIVDAIISSGGGGPSDLPLRIPRVYMHT